MTAEISSSGNNAHQSGQGNADNGSCGIGDSQIDRGAATDFGAFELNVILFLFNAEMDGMQKRARGSSTFPDWLCKLNSSKIAPPPPNPDASRANNWCLHAAIAE